MSELNDSSELQLYSSAVLYVVSAVQCPAEYIAVILDNYVSAVKTSGVSLRFSGVHRRIRLKLIAHRHGASA